jgi:hypothetical protein
MSSGGDIPYYNNRIEITHLAFLYVSAWSCLIRTDYNFVLMFFLYFVWANRQDKLTVTLLFYANIALFVFDFIYFLSTFGSWTTNDPTNTLWNSLRGLHGFVIFTSVVEEVVRLIGLYYLYRRNKM